MPKFAGLYTMKTVLALIVSTIMATGLCLLGFPSIATATSIVYDNRPGSLASDNIKRELFRADGMTNSWETINFSFPITTPAAGDGVFHMFAGGDLNNVVPAPNDPAGNYILASAGGTGFQGPFRILGDFGFPVFQGPHMICGLPPHMNPGSCPIPETVPNGIHAPAGGSFVGDVQGRRNFGLGQPGLIVPQELLKEGTIFTVHLEPRDSIYNLYIDRVSLSYPGSVPLPGTAPLLGIGILALAAWRKYHQPLS
jgi:hypothetical protein